MQQTILQAAHPALIDHWQSSNEELIEALRAALFEFACQFECLIFIAALQHPDARDRFCHSARLMCDGKKADLVLATKHREMFEEWLQLPLEDKFADLEAYAALHNLPLANVARHWLIPGRRDCLIPLGSWTSEKRLFDSDAEILTALASQPARKAA